MKQKFAKCLLVLLQASAVIGLALIIAVYVVLLVLMGCLIYQSPEVLSHFGRALLIVAATLGAWGLISVVYNWAKRWS